MDHYDMEKYVRSDDTDKDKLLWCAKRNKIAVYRVEDEIQRLRAELVRLLSNEKEIDQKLKELKSVN